MFFTVLDLNRVCLPSLFLVCLMIGLSYLFACYVLAGVVKFVGTLDDNLLAPECYVGVHLDEQG